MAMSKEAARRLRKETRVCACGRRMNRLQYGSHSWRCEISKVARVAGTNPAPALARANPAQTNGALVNQLQAMLANHEQAIKRLASEIDNEKKAIAVLARAIEHAKE